LSIKTFIDAAKILAKENHYHEALCLTCIAVDACAAQIKSLSINCKEV
jgi:hypothetical protein